MITLIEAREYLRIGPNTDDFDSEVAGMIEAATQYLASIGCDVEAEPVPAPLKQAALMLIGYFFDNKGLDDKDTRLSPVFMRLVAPYREIEL